MPKYFPLIAIALLVACGDTDSSSGAGQIASGATGGDGGGGAGSGEGGAGGTGGSAQGSGGAGGSAQGSGGAGGGSAAMPVPGQSSAIRDCAPNDGPAITITIGLAARTCDAMPAGSVFRMTFYTHVDSPAGNTWNLAANGGEAQGIYQPAGDPSNLVVVKTGSLSITTWNMVDAKGSYDVILNDGTHLAGSFDAIACLTNQPMCG
jgi:hypothetical protein